MSSESESIRGAINAADVAASEEDLFTCEEALQRALRRVRDQQTEGDHADD